MNWLISSDLHLTDRPKDEYRFGLFGWLREQQKKHKTTATFLLGDITDSKDKHSSKLVNRVIDELVQLCPPVYILKGNHDCTDPENPFFRFLNCIDGIKFVTQPEFVEVGAFMIPHYRTQGEFDAACKRGCEAQWLFCHQTFDGCIAETGSRLTGLSTSLIESFKPQACWAGDIHKPQRVGPVVEYIGAPFHVRFGDNYTPRCLLVKNGDQTDLHFPCPRKWSLTITDPTDLGRQDFKKNDQIKLTLKLTRDEVVEWPALKQECLQRCKEYGLEVHGLELTVVEAKQTKAQLRPDAVLKPVDVLQAYCRAENLGAAIRNAGRELLL